MTETAPERRGALANLGPRGRALLGVFLVLGLLSVGFLLLSGGGEEPGALPTTTRTSTPRPTRTSTATPTPTTTAVPQTDESFEGRDPFQPLVTPSEPGGPGPEPTGSGGPGPTPTSTTNTSDGTETRRVSLDDIFTEDGTRFATVSVDEEQFTVKEGDRFDDSFRLLDLSSNCGTFVFGDERFTLCLGQEVRK